MHGKVIQFYKPEMFSTVFEGKTPAINPLEACIKIQIQIIKENSA